MNDDDRRELEARSAHVVQQHAVANAAALRALHDCTYYESAVTLGMPKVLAGLAMLITAWATEK